MAQKSKKKSKPKLKPKSKSKIKAKSKAPKTKKIKKPAKAKKPARKVKAAKAKPARTKSVKTKKKAAPAKKKKQIVGEGDYAATRKFDKNQAGFVKRNAAAIPAMGKAAERALEGPEGDALRAAEATAADRSRDGFDS